MRQLQKGKTVWIARHGNRQDFVDSNWRNTAARPYDPPLSADGKVQAKLLGKRLKSEPICHIFVSPFLRALETATPVAEERDLPMKIEHGAGEFLHPQWFSDVPKFPTSDELMAKFPRLDLTYVSRGKSCFPEHDERTHCWTRAGQTAQKLVREFEGDLLFISHGATMQGLAYGLVEGYPPIHCGLTALIKIVWNGKSWDMELSGDESHLNPV